MGIEPVGHSEVGFSQAHRWLACPGSVAAQRGRPNVSGPAAQRGTDLHGVAARALEFGVDDEMNALPEQDYDIVYPYVTLVRARHKACGGTLAVEQPFHLQHLHDKLWGTADAVMVYLLNGECWVEIYDLKTGGTPVAVRDHDGKLNPQLSGYLLGGIQVATRVGMRPTRYSIAIFQPVRGGLKETVVERGELALLGADLVQGVEAALAPDAPRIAGDHCLYCLAAADCPALRLAALQEPFPGFPDEDTLDQGVLMAAQQISVDTEDAVLLGALEVAPVVELWLAAVRGEAFRRLSVGQPVGDYKLVAKRARRAWLNEPQALQRIQGAGLDLDDAGEFKLKTPAQMEKVIKRRGLKVDLAPLVVSKSSGAVMAHGDDPRPAVTPGELMFDPEPEE